jgi:hypothetical protein
MLCTDTGKGDELAAFLLEKANKDRWSCSHFPPHRIFSYVDLLAASMEGRILTITSRNSKMVSSCFSPNRKFEERKPTKSFFLRNILRYSARFLFASGSPMVWSELILILKLDSLSVIESNKSGSIRPLGLVESDVRHMAQSMLQVLLISSTISRGTGIGFVRSPIGAVCFRYSPKLSPSRLSVICTILSRLA